MPFTEGALVDWLEQRAPRGPEVVVGIGHDAAVLRVPSGEGLVLKSDQTIEGVHFTRAEAPLALAGRKALARVLSDLGAVGARPIAALCSAALPDDLSESGARELFDGLLELARAHGVSLVGGDLSRSPRGIALDVCGFGLMEGRTPMLRSGARPGDALLVTGPLGGSRAGHHLRFEPRWREGVALAESGRVHACIDLSDGLARDLHLLARSSKVGARIDVEALPRRTLQAGARASVEQALHDGEDFELLFAAAPADVGGLLALPRLSRVALTRIGVVTPAPEGVALVDGSGRASPLRPGGFEHRFGG
jgi:thiamine-monophosphate kinase